MSIDRRTLLTRAAQLGAAATLAPVLDAQARDERPPNILILMTDQERHRDRLPDDLPVPARCWMDEHGTNIDRFHSSSMACTPSRGCLWTGMYGPQTGLYGTFIVGAQFNVDPSIPTIGDLFKSIGYRTAFFGKWHLSYPGEIPTSAEGALDTLQGNPLRGNGFDDSVISPPSDVSAYNDGYVNDPIWTRQALDWLDAHGKDEQPWLCILSLLNPHDIQYYPRGFAVDFERPDYGMEPDPSWFEEPKLDDKPSGQERFRKVVEVISGTPAGGARREGYVRSLLNLYCDLIVGTDEMLQAMIKKVIDLGVLEDTVLVRTADHGELGGAHSLQNKGTTMYDEQNRIPFTVVYPKRFPAGGRSRALGEQVDLLPTLLELGGVADPVARFPWLRGVSLVSALEQPESPGPRSEILYRIDEFAITSVGNEKPTNTHIRAFFDGRYKFARYVAVKDGWFAGPEFVASQEYELYDTWEDPYEIRNLANDRGYAALRDDLLARLGELEKAKWGPVGLPAFGPGQPIDALPVVPNAGITQGGVPSPWPDTGRPGSYLIVPGRQPTPTSWLYEGELPATIGGGPTPDGVELAAFFCELMPRGS
ncbi:sulfatase-like hydrolase/transferase [Conexibacter sp. W3-3-2]|uniref:sulfatase-like hydrolase/transferase n=1 Tax=Conexibacter sp. W3-3-2 TaxID=2675227 RepID=UPI0012B9BD96|nr:sulfatase-like hydrolase/transferase [Conexibacter sp. W3-3-2]MTD44270.1 sulfatase-like hydrolase/transferase [Conexibacter sp. W3-3-2]